MDPAVTPDRAWALARLAEARVGRLGTVTADGHARVVPVCFALDGEAGPERGAERVVSAVDHKPKSTTALARLADITRTGHATLLVDHYDDEQWSALWWVRVTGTAAVLDPGDPTEDRARAALVAKYPQYRERPPHGPVYAIALDDLTWWRGAGDPASP